MAKLLSKIYLINWYLFGEELIAIDRHTVILGANGAGKSSLIDAIQTVLLGGDKRYIRYNPGVDERSKRSLMSYALGVWKGIEDGEELKVRNNCHSYIALEFKSDISDAIVTIGVGITAQWPSKGEIETHFILKDTPIAREFFINNDNVPIPPDYFVRQMKQRFGNLFFDYDSHERFLNALMSHLSSGGIKFHPDKFRKNFRNALIFKKIDSVEQFVKDYVLEERPVDTRRLKRSLEVFREIKEKAEKTQERLDHLKKITAVLLEIQRHSTDSAINTSIAALSYIDRHRREMSIYEQEMKDLNARWQKLLDEEENLLKDKECISDTIAKLKIRLHENAQYVRIQELKKDIEYKTKELYEKRERFEKTISNIKTITTLPTEILSEFENKNITESLKRLLTALSNEDYQAISICADKIVGAVIHEKNRIDMLSAEASISLSSLKDKIDSIKGKIRNLQKGEVPLPLHYQKLREILNKSLKDAGYNDGAVPVCDLIDIKDKEWQIAIESFLGDNRYSLIVHPDRFMFCLHIYRRLQESEAVYGARLVDSERCIKEAIIPSSNSVAQEVEIDETCKADSVIKSAALSYMHILLGNVIKAETDEELRSHKRALTKDCSMFANYSVRKLSPERHLVFGRSGRETYIRNLSTERDAMLAEVAAIEKRLLGYKDKKTILDNISNSLSGAELIVDYIKTIDSIQKELEIINQEIEKLQKGEVEEIEAEIARHNNTIGEIEKRLNQIKADSIGNRDAYSKIEKKYTELNIYVKQKEEFLSGISLCEDDKSKALLLYKKQIEQGIDFIDIEVLYTKRSENAQKSKTEAEKSARSELMSYAAKYEHAITEEMLSSPLSAFQWVDSEIKRLEETELARYLNESKKAMEDAQLIFQEEFIHKLKDNILSSDTQRNELNAILKNHEFHGERYIFERHPNPRYRPFLDMVMDSENTRIDTALFEEKSDFRQKHRKALDELERLFRAGTDINAERELHDISDYRNYYRYEIVSIDREGNKTTLTHRLKTGSGGEIQTPFYVAIASALAYTYRIGEVKDGITLAVFDEAFNKMDQGNVENAINFMKELGLQVILAAPDDKTNIFLPHINTALMIYRRGSKISIDKIITKPSIKELYAQAKSPV